MKLLQSVAATSVVLFFVSVSSAQTTTTGNDSSTTKAQDKKEAPATPTSLPITGDYQFTFNGSTIGRVLPSMGHRLQLATEPKFGGTFNLRIEYYTEGSYNGDPPGMLLRNLNEHKFELQLMYNRPIA